MGSLKANLLILGTKLTSVAVVVATVLAPTCRETWYEPEEPKNLQKLLRK